MLSDVLTTFAGNITADPELRFTQTGLAVANFTVAVSPRKFDSVTNEFVDGDAVFCRCTVWRSMAENLAVSVKKGDRVIVSGKWLQRSYEKDGNKVTTYEVEVEDCGPSVQFAVAPASRRRSSEGQTALSPVVPVASVVPEVEPS